MRAVTLHRTELAVADVPDPVPERGQLVLDVVRRSAQPRDAVLGWSPRAGRFVDVERHHDAVVIPGLVIYRLDDRLFFVNSRYFRGRVRDAIRGAPYPVTTLVFVPSLIAGDAIRARGRCR